MNTGGISRISPITAAYTVHPGRYGLARRHPEGSASPAPGNTGFDRFPALREETALPSGLSSLLTSPGNSRSGPESAFPAPLVATSQALLAAATAIPEAPGLLRSSLQARSSAYFPADPLNIPATEDNNHPDAGPADTGNLNAEAAGPRHREGVSPADQATAHSDSKPQDKGQAQKGDAEESSPQGIEGALTEEEQKEVAALKARDREVRSHEQAHKSAGGGLAGSASYETTQGPDGKSYAVAGEVPIDASEASSPKETITKARQIRAAALAPAEPSSQDYQVAARASQMEAEARQEQAALEAEEARAESGDPAATGPAEAASSEGSPTDTIFATSGRHALRRAAEAYQAVAGAFLPVPFGSALSIAV